MAKGFLSPSAPRCNTPARVSAFLDDRRQAFPFGEPEELAAFVGV